jgi:ribonucleoside-diphosphate reductase alpha chain
MAVIFQRGGGTGFNFSALRPKNAPLSSGGTSSGSVSFMNLFDGVTEVVRQGGFRRGAAISVLNYNHPDILDFCRSKLTRVLTNFNLSVLWKMEGCM